MSEEQEKRIYVDEDWKSRVTAEKEAARQKTEGAGEEGEQGAGGPSPAELGGEQFPPASFEMLITALATEAMMGMGQIPHPVTGQTQPNLSQARYAIDMLEVLQEKTKGNLEDREDTALGDLLHQLRMAFIAAQTQGAGSGGPPSQP